LIPLGKLKRLLFIALLVVFACEDKFKKEIIMKKTLLIILPLLLIVGCSKEPINIETTLVERDGIYYTRDTNKPYSGLGFSLYDDGKKKEEGTYKNGKKDGKWTEWHANGQIKEETTYKDGDILDLEMLQKGWE